ncbi:PspC domain-containing protein [Listeria floridensis FSL S10-1187]|uniref:PspC domain-containing protein n=1 Tax=Listeria floridensis FSL S10-1187 TaxID=1265817 RepID=A0ABN0RBM6_9LIST|nr:PspC domain-containing protein [Listeria floridensis]EUJ25595.1 PspC domain-containing protein [Listeria floridensis FSL S10-1187]
MEKKLRRSRVDRKVGGVFGGISEYTGIDATILRLVFIIIAIFTMKTGIAIVAYIIALFVIPSSNMNNDEVRAEFRKRQDEKARYVSERRKERFDRMDEKMTRKQEQFERHLHKNEKMRPQHSPKPPLHHGKSAHNRSTASTPRQRPTREFTFDATTFTAMKVQIATGDVSFRVWDKDEMKMRVVLAVHEKARSIRQLSEDKIWDYFFSQTMLDIGPGQFVFESKKDILKTDIVFTIPKRLYEQVKIQLLNGNLKFDDISVEDTIIKIKHGDLRSAGASGKFLSADLQDGEIYFKRASIENLDLTTLKGDVVVDGNLLTTVAKTKLGDVEYILQNDTATSADLKAPAGDIRIQIPASWNVDGTLGTKREKIYFDLKNAKVWDESNEALVFTQNAEEISNATLQAKVENGIIKVTELERTQV